MTAPLLSVPLAHVHPNPDNPRGDLGDLTDLVASIRAHGILQPLLVTKRQAGGYLILAGHRRHAAATIAGRQQVPVLVIAPQYADNALLLAMIENLHRTDLAPLDEARACRALLDADWTKEQIARQLARSKHWVSDRLVLLELPADAQQLMATGELPVGKATVLARQVARHRCGSVVVGARSAQHFTTRHKLARWAQHLCDGASHPAAGRIGPACGGCWEQTIRQHERDGQLPTLPVSRPTTVVVDEVAVQRALAGDHVSLKPTERAAAIDHLDKQDLSARQIATRLGTTSRTVQRRRATRVS